MAIPFDIQKFPSEIITGVSVFVVTQLPKAWRRVRDRLAPNPLLPNLRVTIKSCRVDLQGDSGDVALTIELLNHTGRRVEAKQFQISFWIFDCCQMPTPTSSVTPPHLSVPRSSWGEIFPRLRLQKRDVETIWSRGVKSQNPVSTPQHRIRVCLEFVVRGRLRKPVLRQLWIDWMPVVLEASVPPTPTQTPAVGINAPAT